MTATLDDLLSRTTTYPDASAWLLERPLGLGASDSAGVLGQGRDRRTSEYAVWLEKTSSLESKPASAPMLLGLRMEELIRQELEARGLKFAMRGGYTSTRHRTIPFLRASLDGVIVGHNGEPVLSELKTTTDEPWTDAERVPIDYRIQIQHQLAVADVEEAYLTAAFLKPSDGDDDKHPLARLLEDAELVTYVYRRDASFSQFLETTLSKWWQRHVVEKQPPFLDGSSATRDALKRAFPTSNPDLEVELPADAADHLARRAAAVEARDAASTVIDEEEAYFMAKIADAQAGTIAGVGRVSYGTIYRKAKQCENCGHEIAKPGQYRRFFWPKLGG